MAFGLPAKRILLLMRENGLLSPHRHLPRSDAAHDGRITTDAPNLMWGTDATQIPTVLDGKVWLFAVVEHWNAEGLGWHVAKIGDRYAAPQAVGMAIQDRVRRRCRRYRTRCRVPPRSRQRVHGRPLPEPNQVLGHGPELRLRRRARNQRRGRTLLPKEQLVYGRIYQTIGDIRAAVSEFFQRYNAQWLIAKNGPRSPRQRRFAWEQANMKQAA
jgi:putative transposase